MLFGNPFKDNYPDWIWKGLKNSRQGKDSLNPFFKAFNSTKVYDIFFKRYSSFWIFGVTSAMVMTWGWGRGWNYVWKSVNKGKLYKDCPYTYPEED